MMTQIVHQMKISSLHALKDLCHSYLKVTYHYLMISPVYGWKPPTTQQNGHHLKKSGTNDYRHIPNITIFQGSTGQYCKIALPAHIWPKSLISGCNKNFLITDIHPKEVINETGKKSGDCRQ
ncbi:hypothetical protein KPC142_06247 [Klebsiella quasipneumoniae]|nr:hypothetical protein KPC142_06247 [Klebsiella quasipneumoniae]